MSDFPFPELPTREAILAKDKELTERPVSFEHIRKALLGLKDAAPVKENPTIGKAYAIPVEISVKEAEQLQQAFARIGQEDQIKLFIGGLGRHYLAISTAYEAIPVQQALQALEQVEAAYNASQNQGPRR